MHSFKMLSCSDFIIGEKKRKDEMELNYPRPNEKPLGKDKLCDDGDKSL